MKCMYPQINEIEKIKSMQKIHNECVPYINPNDFPQILNIESICSFREILNETHPDRIVCKPYVVVDNACSYVEIYFFSTFDNSKECLRFVFEHGKQMTEEAEQNFIFLCSSEALYVEKKDYCCFYKALVNSFSFLNLPVKAYTGKKSDIGALLDRTYYSFFPNLLEKFYKAGLHVIAINFPFIADEIIDINGKSPSEIIMGCANRFLRSLNQKKMVSLLFKKESFDEALSIYKRFSSFFPEDISFGQYHYLQLSDEGKVTFRKVVFDQLHDYTFREADAYQVYEELSRNSELKEYWDFSKKPPKPKEIHCKVETLLALKFTLKNKEYVNKFLKDKAEKCTYKNPSEEDYYINPLDSCDAFVNEAFAQRNCLLRNNYLVRIEKGETQIFFMRKKSNPESSLITLEIIENKIENALGKNNRALCEEESLFIEKWANFNAIQYDQKDR